MPVRKEDAHRALELLEDYHTRLSKPQDRPLKTAIERVIRIFKSRLFQALLDIQEFYESTLLDESKTNHEKTLETLRIASKWERDHAPGTIQPAGGNRPEPPRTPPPSRSQAGRNRDTPTPPPERTPPPADVTLSRAPRQPETPPTVRHNRYEQSYEERHEDVPPPKVASLSRAARPPETPPTKKQTRYYEESYEDDRYGDSRPPAVVTLSRAARPPESPPTIRQAPRVESPPPAVVTLPKGAVRPPEVPPTVRQPAPYVEATPPAVVTLSRAPRQPESPPTARREAPPAATMSGKRPGVPPPIAPKPKPPPIAPKPTFQEHGQPRHNQQLSSFGPPLAHGEDVATSEEDEGPAPPPINWNTHPEFARPPTAYNKRTHISGEEDLPPPPPELSPSPAGGGEEKLGPIDRGDSRAHAHAKEGQLKDRDHRDRERDRE
ncbi:hypothetical protein EGW08_022464, partial [Elysia chlorotica]